LRASARGKPADWIALGLTLGVGLENKTSVLWLCVAIAVGLLATPARATLRTRWPYVAAAIAAALFLPYIYWEMRNGWPTLEFMRNARPTRPRLALLRGLRASRDVRMPLLPA
jgi:4-amino-4-deoxy-L-arabinose transferase-like glycosyltransferase